jgi:sec-independent protein translocase protein TatA
VEKTPRNGGLAGAGAPYRIVDERAEKIMDLFAPSHLLVILVIVLIIFGPSKLGDVGGALGKAIKDFKKAMNEDEPKPVAPVAKAEETKPIVQPADTNPEKRAS